MPLTALALDANFVYGISKMGASVRYNFRSLLCEPNSVSIDVWGRCTRC